MLLFSALSHLSDLTYTVGDTRPPLVRGTAEQAGQQMQCGEIGLACDNDPDLEFTATKKNSGHVKVLLLGLSESGKSTVLRNFQFSYWPKPLEDYFEGDLHEGAQPPQTRVKRYIPPHPVNDAIISFGNPIINACLGTFSKVHCAEFPGARNLDWTQYALHSLSGLDKYSDLTRIQSPSIYVPLATPLLRTTTKLSTDLLQQTNMPASRGDPIDSASPSITKNQQPHSRLAHPRRGHSQQDYPYPGSSATSHPSSRISAPAWTSSDICTCRIPGCGKLYNRVYDLNRHLAGQKHRAALEEADDEAILAAGVPHAYLSRAQEVLRKKHQCDSCQLSFSRGDDLKKHLTSAKHQNLSLREYLDVSQPSMLPPPGFRWVLVPVSEPIATYPVHASHLPTAQPIVPNNHNLVASTLCHLPSASAPQTLPSAAIFSQLPPLNGNSVVMGDSEMFGGLAAAAPGLFEESMDYWFPT